MTPFRMPRLYPILDRDVVRSSSAVFESIVKLWLDAGAEIIQYRNKSDDAREMLADAREIVRIAYARGKREQVKLIMNDRADLCLAAEFEGVHLGQDDLSPEGARKVVGPKRLIGISCHNEAQIEAAEATAADYLAIGPMFATKSKANPDAVVGLERLGEIRRLTKKPLVAIGGIGRENCRRVLESGADSVAVISDLFGDPERDIGELLGAVGF